jgi:short-subunit dehydrogenase
MKYALITGGTSGIGYELARIFARNQFEIIIVSGNKDKLIKAKSNLEKEFNRDIKTIEQDLSENGSAQKVYNQIKEMNINISILVNNAGVGVVGPIEEVSIQKEENMLILNILTLTELTKLFLIEWMIL